MLIRKSIALRCSPERAFAVFTRDIGHWWPINRGFFYGPEPPKDFVLDNHVGGRLYERFTDGGEFEIGHVLRYEPPHLIVFTWKAPEWETATEVEVRFTAAPEGTRVELEHRGWTASTAEKSNGFGGGWDIVLGCLVACANKIPAIEQGEASS